VSSSFAVSHGNPTFRRRAFPSPAVGDAISGVPDSLHAEPPLWLLLEPPRRRHLLGWTLFHMGQLLPKMTQRLES
jgi:hypothetical protein